MYRPPLPATTPPKHARRPEWDLTAFAQLSAEQSHLRSSPTHFPTKGRWLKPNGSLELPKRKFQAKSGADTPTIGELFFTRELQVHLHNRLHQSGAGTFRKQKETSGEQARTRNAAKTSDEAGANPLFAARCITSSVGSLPPHQFSECTRRLSKSTGGSPFLNSHLRAGTVTAALRARVTVAVTNAVTLDACKTTRSTKVINRIGHGENPGVGWSDPILAKCLWPKTAWVAPAQDTRCVEVFHSRPEEER
jgi:hypothetical protein